MLLNACNNVLRIYVHKTLNGIGRRMKFYTLNVLTPHSYCYNCAVPLSCSHYNHFISIQFQAQNMGLDTGVKFYCDNSSFAHYYSSFVLDCCSYNIEHCMQNNNAHSPVVYAKVSSVFILFSFDIGLTAFFLALFIFQEFLVLRNCCGRNMPHNAILSNWIVARFIHIKHPTFSFDLIWRLACMHYALWHSVFIDLVMFICHL